MTQSSQEFANAKDYLALVDSRPGYHLLRFAEAMPQLKFEVDANNYLWVYDFHEVDYDQDFEFTEARYYAKNSHGTLYSMHSRGPQMWLSKVCIQPVECICYCVLPVDCGSRVLLKDEPYWDTPLIDVL